MIQSTSSELKVKTLCFNGEEGVFAMAIFTFNFSPEGPLKIDPYFSTFKLPNYDTSRGQFRLVCEIMIFIGIIANIVGEFNELKDIGFNAYVHDFWNVFDIANISLILLLFFSWVGFYHSMAKHFNPRPR
jgi:hypothetical protein